MSDETNTDLFTSVTCALVDKPERHDFYALIDNYQKMVDDTLVDSGQALANARAWSALWKRLARRKAEQLHGAAELASTLVLRQVRQDYLPISTREAITRAEAAERERDELRAVVDECLRVMDAVIAGLNYGAKQGYIASVSAEAEIYAHFNGYEDSPNIEHARNAARALLDRDA